MNNFGDFLCAEYSFPIIHSFSTDKTNEELNKNSFRIKIFSEFIFYKIYLQERKIEMPL